MKNHLLKARHWLLLLLLGLLGGSVCSCTRYDEPELMYGVPTTGYNDSIVDKP